MNKLIFFIDFLIRQIYCHSTNNFLSLFQTQYVWNYFHRRSLGTVHAHLQTGTIRQDLHHDPADYQGLHRAVRRQGSHQLHLLRQQPPPHQTDF